MACEYLKDCGYKILNRNVKEKWGEIDIIALDKDRTVVFVEVKTRRNLQSLFHVKHGTQNSSQLNPEENISAAKLKKMQRTALLYAGSHSELITDKKGWRIDAIAIDILTDEENNVVDYSLRHYENIG